VSVVVPIDYILGFVILYNKRALLLQFNI